MRPVAAAVIGGRRYPNPVRGCPGAEAGRAVNRGSHEREFLEGFFARDDEADDADFYASPRFVTHIDYGAIAAVGALFEHVGRRGAVLDLLCSWVLHLLEKADALTGLRGEAPEAPP